MLWIRSEKAWTDDPKVRSLGRRLKVSEGDAFLVLHKIMHWMADNAQDGNALSYGADELALAAGWKGSSDKLVATLVESEWLETDGKLVDFEDRVGPTIKSAMAARDRARRKRSTFKQADSSRTVREQNANESRTLREQFAVNSTVQYSTYIKSKTKNQ